MRFTVDLPMLARLSKLLLIPAALATHAPASAELIEDVRSYRATHEKTILRDFEALLSLPNVATNPSDIERNATFIKAQLDRRGFTTKLLSAGAGTPPSLFAELKAPNARRTVIFYAHFDGQPVSQTDWKRNPYVPALLDSKGERAIAWESAASLDPEWRIFARSAGDDKISVQALLSAFDALKASGRKPSVNVKIFYDGEEEAGSPNLVQLLRESRQFLAADLMVLGDGPRHPSGAMQLFFGARGSTTLEVTVYGPARALHDGHYGNWVPNPAVMLVHLLASLRDEEGQILIPGFGSDVRPLSSTEQSVLEHLPDVETGLRNELALGRTESRERLAEAISRPALNVRGIRVGDVEERASNTIASEAKASIDFRTVPDQRPDRIQTLTEAYLQSLGWKVVHDTPNLEARRAYPKIVKLDWKLGYRSYRLDLNSTPARALAKATERSLGSEPLLIPMVGGSVPMSVFDDALHIPIVIVPVSNYDNNQHAANENIKLGALWDAIDLYAGLMGGLDW